MRMRLWHVSPESGSPFHFSNWSHGDGPVPWGDSAHLARQHGLRFRVRRMPRPAWEQYEEQILEQVREWAGPDATIEFDKRLPGKESGGDRQIDILVLIDDVQTDFGIPITNRGWSKKAEERLPSGSIHPGRGRADAGDGAHRRAPGADVPRKGARGAGGLWKLRCRHGHPHFCDRSDAYRLRTVGLRDVRPIGLI